MQSLKRVALAGIGWTVFIFLLALFDPICSVFIHSWAQFLTEACFPFVLIFTLPIVLFSVSLRLGWVASFILSLIAFAIAVGWVFWRIAQPVLLQQ